MKKNTVAKPEGKGWLKHWFPKRYKRVRVLLIIFAVLVVARIALPYVVLYVLNDRLAKVDGYYGHLEDVHISILSGSYSLDEIYLDHVDSVTKDRTPFLAAHRVDLSVEWTSLLGSKLVGEIEADSFEVTFTRDKMEPEQVKEDKNILRDLGKSFMPLKLNRIALQNSSIHYIDLSSSPELDLFMTDVSLLAQELSTEKDTALMPSTLMMKGKLYDGTMLVGAKMDLLADEPTFDLNAQVTNMNLVKLNKMFTAYAKLDVSKGDFAVYIEAASRNGKLTGYLKPIIRHLDVLGPEDRHDNVLQKFWEGFVGTVGFAITNQKHDQIATKIAFQGTVSKAETNIWFSIYEVLRNAFVHVMRSSIDNEITIASVDFISDKKLKNKQSSKEKKKGIGENHATKKDKTTAKERRTARNKKHAKAAQ